MDPIKKK